VIAIITTTRVEAHELQQTFASLLCGYNYSILFLYYVA